MCFQCLCLLLHYLCSVLRKPLPLMIQPHKWNLAYCMVNMKVEIYCIFCLFSNQVDLFAINSQFLWSKTTIWKLQRHTLGVVFIECKDEWVGCIEIKRNNWIYLFYLHFQQVFHFSDFHFHFSADQPLFKLNPLQRNEWYIRN